MDFPAIPCGRSPRSSSSLQGPRPTPLKVCKTSHKIKKPPVVPPPHAAAQHHRHAPPPPPPPPPVIIYTVSPKIIHTNPNEFMSLVQRLTGPNNNTTSPSAISSSSPSFAIFQENEVVISPAARYASIEKTKAFEGRKVQVVEQEVQVIEGIEIEIQRSSSIQFPGILSPNPNSLSQIIPQNFFSPPSEYHNTNHGNNSSNYSNPLSFFYDLSPVLQGSNNKNYLESSFVLHSPSTFVSPHNVSMPSPNTLDLFNSLFDL